MQRIWILSELYFPEQTSTGYILTKIAEGLSEEYEVKVITGPATNFLNCEHHQNYEIKDGVEIFRCQSTLFNKDIFWGRLVNLVTQSISILGKSWKLCQHGDVILVVTNPPLLPFVALILKWLKNCQFILLIHDVYPEVLVAAGLCSSSSLLAKIGRRVSVLLYTQASKIITLGRDMTKIVKDKLSNNSSIENLSSKIYLIPNWAEHETVRPDDRDNNPLLQELGCSDRFVVLYAGNMGKTHGIKDLAEVATILQVDGNIHFVVVGFGAKKKWLEEYVKSQNLQNMSIIPLSARPRSEQSVSLNAGDVALISYVPGMAGVSVPSRMYNQMAAGKPIIAVADDWSELAEVVREENIGWVIKPGDIEGLVRTIQFAATNRELCVEMGIRAAEVARTKYSFAQTNQAYKKLFKEIFSISS
ncbi:MAG: glycosyltransferase family 4 protein [Mojavia pulchra JT2-VF2]|jgi:glycosyltransferase involved in cell wall biosynthesis|uniref:Glycosyltransferase family 4 protein n=1 Tax=Mojavia pulchra JT2-VF2 TaxID=287848 RepID=A0A951PYP2_9NOST|nr:glycosyltransferase family 4 protein [Mojavia pulchra JT2-VF2]